MLFFNLASNKQARLADYWFLSADKWYFVLIFASYAVFQGKIYKN
jgi:hypothetical protein